MLQVSQRSRSNRELQRAKVKVSEEFKVTSAFSAGGVFRMYLAFRLGSSAPEPVAFRTCIDERGTVMLGQLGQSPPGPAAPSALWQLPAAALSLSLSPSVALAGSELPSDSLGLGLSDSVPGSYSVLTVMGVPCPEASKLMPADKRHLEA
eukprot:CAMPEP_0195029632 /NCGR_PEP_ID=MMETSP0326_2-20130528/57098_1 /TAXON_ID=2866 ORGANISM="Crypthecodinium cohnii, Strain Seligo" /NCGR_SAMPLE_ID=MMETSP0326_2 /ASSEMBLY_ACC=CAM_ASM_000348 /LENGTH=149 /DNA_ID=CAMNT_0040052607 /DNA_START=418 /DNA_END=867 /DNA_ORIENTATION=+